MACGNHTLSQGVFPVIGKQKKMWYPEQYKNTIGKDCEIEKIMKFLKDTGI